MKNRAFLFLLSSFLSAVGDAVLVFAVPVGLGLETRDLRAAVLMWLIPAVAMFLSSFLSRRMERRYHSARADYGKLLLGIAALELVISGAALMFRTPIQTVILITGFVFFYALAKEGIPRLLYLVSVYRYFVEPEEYSRIAGTSAGLNILAALAGTCFAGGLIAVGSWRVALVFDAATFVVFGLAILYAGRDPSAEPPETHKNPARTGEGPWIRPHLAWIQVLVPLLFGVNALIWNYLPLLNARLAVLPAAFSIFLIGFLRVPGMLSGLFMRRILKNVSVGSLILGLPVLYLAASVAFSAAPSVILFAGFVILQGLVSGAYWPADLTARNALPGPELIRFNTAVLQKLAITQFVGCLLALWIFAPTGPGLSVLSSTALGLIAVSVVYHLVVERGRLGTARTIGLGALVIAAALGVAGCHSSRSEQTIFLPSVSQNMDLRPELTYAATAILNDTSAHFVRVSRDLTIQGEALSRYASLDGGKRYDLELNPEYRSARGEPITAEDVAFSIRYYLSKKRSLAGALATIEGADDCNSGSCSLRGLEVLNATRLRVTLNEPDLRWIEKLASPWLLLLKRGKPETETIGTCVIPYQTGHSLITACDAAGVHLRSEGQRVVVSQGAGQGARVATLLTESPSQEVSPSLTVLAAFANPHSKRLTERERVQILSGIRSNAHGMSVALHLKFAALLTPEWLGVEAPADLASITSRGNAGCSPGRPIRVLLDTSLPSPDILEDWLKAKLGCSVEFSLTNADTYFQEFDKADIGIAWFTPDFLDLYDIFAPFDCSTANACSFDWHDPALQHRIDKIRRSGFLGEADKNTVLEIERLLLRRGYAAPIAEMNWWIRKADGAVVSIHPAGLFQVRVSDFL